MQNSFYKPVLAALSAVALFGCKPKLDAPDSSAGSANFSNFVAVGNSITSGFANGALYYDGQQVSFVNLMNTQFKLVGGGDFKQPLMSSSSIGVGSSGNAPLYLTYATDCLGATSLSPKPKAAQGDVAAFANNIYAAQGPFNNMGVPGAKAVTVPVAGYGNPANGPGNYNPFFTRMASNPATASMLSDAVARNATFFSLFIGNNDVLAYALAGGSADFISPVPVFNASYDTIIKYMTANGAKGVIGNIPDVITLPHFTTVPYNGLTLDATKAAQLQAIYTPLGPDFHFQAGPNPFVIKDPSAALGFRQIHSDELILLSIPLDSVKCHGYGSTIPIPEKYVLTTTEITAIQNATNAFNAKIQAVASAKGLAFVDVNAFLKQAKKGITYNGINLNTDFVKGGAFSLDGFHLTPIGNALLANEFLKAINSTYGATIPLVDATIYKGVLFP